MAHLNGNFATAAAGTLTVTFSADFWTSFANSGGAFGRGPADFSVRCLVKNAGGSVVAESVISRQSVFSTTVLADYPGGNAVWNISTETLAYVFGGNVGSMGAQNLSARVRLLKR